MTQEQSHTMRWVLFWVFLVMFALAGIGTLGMIFLGWGTSAGEERRSLVTILVGQTATSVIALFYFLFGIKRGASFQMPSTAPKDESQELKASAELAQARNECAQLREENRKLAMEIQRLGTLRDRILGELGGGESLTIQQLSQRLGTADTAPVQAAVGRLFQDNLIEENRLAPSGSFRVRKTAN